MKNPRGMVKNQIDYIMNNKKYIVQSIEVIQRVNIGSDHRIVSCRIKSNNRLERKKMMQSKALRIKTEVLFQNLEEHQIKLQNMIKGPSNKVF